MHARRASSILRRTSPIGDGDVKDRSMRWAWGVAIAGIVLAYAAIVSQEHRQLAAVRALERSTYDAANRNERIISRGATLISERNYLRGDIAHMLQDSAHSTDALLSELDRESADLGVRVISVTPTSDAVQRPGTAPQDFRSDAFTIEVDGTFDALLSLLRELTSAAALIGVDSIAMTRSDGAEQSRSPRLRATLSAHTYELGAHWSEEFR